MKTTRRKLSELPPDLLESITQKAIQIIRDAEKSLGASLSFGHMKGDTSRTVIRVEEMLEKREQKFMGRF